MKRNFRGVLTSLWKDSWRQRQAQPRTTLIRINHVNCHSLEAIFARIWGNSSNKNIKYGIAPAVGKKGGGVMISQAPTICVFIFCIKFLISFMCINIFKNYNAS